MDTSKEYILMSKQAAKYLPTWTAATDLDPFDYVEYQGDVVSAAVVMCGLHPDIWTRLYRQDQLQAMMTEYCGDDCEKFWDFVDFMDAGLNAHNTEWHLTRGMSGEQLWLCFVMYELYDRVWEDDDFKLLESKIAERKNESQENKTVE